MATPLDAMYEEMAKLNELSQTGARTDTEILLHGFNGVMQGLAAINEQLQALRDDPPRVPVRY